MPRGEEDELGGLVDVLEKRGIISHHLGQSWTSDSPGYLLWREWGTVTVYGQRSRPLEQPRRERMFPVGVSTASAAFLD